MQYIAGILLVQCLLCFLQVQPNAIAKCNLVPNPSLGSESTVNGDILFSQMEDELSIQIFVKNLNPGSVHGFHIHAVGNISTCEASTTHYNPENYTHGAPEEKVRHVGDLGNVIADSNGEVNATIMDKYASLDLKFPVVGRTVVVHEKEDDMGKTDAADSKKTGNAGKRLACCIITKME